jgi:hypothetical protein
LYKSLILTDRTSQRHLSDIDVLPIGEIPWLKISRKKKGFCLAPLPVDQDPQVRRRETRLLSPRKILAQPCLPWKIDERESISHPKGLFQGQPSSSPALIPGKRIKNTGSKSFFFAITEPIRMPDSLLREFTLDFTGQSGVPSQWGITLSQVSKLFWIQSGGREGIQLTPDWRRGVFNLLATTPDTATFLRNFSLKVPGPGGKEIVLSLHEKRKSRPGIWISVKRSCIGPMATLPGDYFDGILKEAGFDIIKGTSKTFYKGTSLYNGYRSALVERGEGHLDRDHEWRDDEGNIYKFFIEYDSQPHHCHLGCNTYHPGDCPKKRTRREARENDGQQPIVFFSSSQLRLGEDTTKTRFDCIPGAKIGHIANHINNDPNILNADIVVVHAGHNMDRGNDEETDREIRLQTDELVKVVQPLAERKRVFVLDPVVGSIPDETTASELEEEEKKKANHGRTIRGAMKRASGLMGADFVSLKAMDFDPNTDIEEDKIHYSKSGTQKIFKEVERYILDKTGKNPLEGVAAQDKPYKAIKNHHYKFGCYKCTFMHARGPCPERIVPAHPSVPTQPTPPQPTPPQPTQQQQQLKQQQKQQQQLKQQQQQQPKQQQQKQNTRSQSKDSNPASASSPHVTRSEKRANDSPPKDEKQSKKNDGKITPKK